MNIFPFLHNISLLLHLDNFISFCIVFYVFAIKFKTKRIRPIKLEDTLRFFKVPWWADANNKINLHTGVQVELTEVPGFLNNDWTYKWVHYVPVYITK